MWRLIENRVKLRAPKRPSGVLLAVFALCIAGCDGANQGVQIGTGQAPDPVVVDFPIAYVKSPLPVDNQGDFVQPDLRELLTFEFGADLFVKDRASPSTDPVNVTGELMQGLGAVRDVAISFDGTAVLFAMRGPVDLNLALDDDDQPTWNIWEYSLESGELRRIIADDITAETGHDIAPQYLPDGRIIFSSTRQLRSKAVLVDEGKQSFESQDEDVDEPAFLLHVMNADGNAIEQVSFNQSHDMDPSVLANGQIVFSRWDHAARNNGINLYRMNPDGSRLELLYGQNSHDTGTNGQLIQFTGPREIADGRIMSVVRPFTNSAGGGDIVLIDTPVYVENTQPNRDNAGLNGPAQQRATITNVTTEAGSVSPGGRYLSVYPIQDGTGRLLVSWSQCRLADIVDPNVQPPAPVFYYPCTDENLLNPDYVEADPIYGIWIYDPRDETQKPVVPPEEGFVFTDVVAADPRTLPPVILDGESTYAPDPGLAADGAAVISIRSVYDLDGVPIVDIDATADPAQTTAEQRPARFLRVVKAVSLPDEDDLELDDTAFGPTRNLGMKEIVGYSMIEPDGSVMIKVPANTALQVSVLDGSGRRISARHNNWLQLIPGQLLECNGCHVAQGGLSHGRSDAFDSAYAGAQVVGASFNNGTVDALFVGEIGETMAEVRARITCATADCSSLEPSMDIEYEDVWTDEAKAGRAADAGFSYAYVDLSTPPPASVNCITQPWAANCRIVINYEDHIHPLWSAPRLALDPDTGQPLVDPVSLQPITNTCTNCHALVDAMGANRIPDGQLDLTGGPDIEVPEHLRSYRELLFPDNEQTIDATGNLVDVMVVIGVDENGNDILAPVTVQPPMSAIGANASNPGFFDLFEAGGTHDGYLSDAEMKLLAEWLDVGAQYYNNPFDVPIN